MPTYSITGPDGKTYSIDGPEGATQDQVVAEIQKRQQQQPAPMTAGDVASGAIRNFPSSAGRFVKDIAEPIMHPIETAKTIGKVGLGAAEYATGGAIGTEHEPYAAAVGKFFVDRYGGIENVKHTLATDPVGFAADLSTVLTGGETALARAPGIAGRAAEVAGTAGRAVDPILGAARATRGAAAVASVPMRNVALAKQAARTDVARALERDETTAAEVSKKSVPGREAVLPDVGGENVRGLTERVAQTPGAGRTIVVPYLAERQKQQLTRMGSDLDRLLGTGEKTAHQAIEQTVAQRAEAAAPLYDSTYRAGDFEVWSPELERLSSSPSVEAAMRGAVRIWRDNAIADGFGAMNPAAISERGGLLKFTGKKLPVFPNIQFWDYTKRLLDDQTRQAIKAGQNQKARTLTRLAQQLRGQLDVLVPEYKAARDAWAGPSSYIESIESGKEILSKKVGPEELRAEFGQLSEADKEAFRYGAAASILSTMSADPAKLADMTKFLRSPLMRQKIEAIMPSAHAAEQWRQILDFEVQSSEMTGRGLGGPATARRLAEMTQAGEAPIDLVTHLIGSPLMTPFRLTLSTIGNKIRDTLRSKVDKEIARILTSPAALKSLPSVLGNAVRPRSPALLKTLPTRPVAHGVYQAGRETDAVQQVIGQ